MLLFTLHSPCIFAQADETSLAKMFAGVTAAQSIGSADPLPSFLPTHALPNSLACVCVQADETSLAKVFAGVASAKASGELTVLDWGVANSTLEEVFIKFARSVGAKSAD